MDEPPEDLIESLRIGSPQAFRAVYKRHGQTMLRVALRILRNRTDAEDAVQETFLSLFRNAADFEGRSALGTWLFRVLIRCCLRLDRRRPGQSVEAGEAGASRDAAAGAVQAEARVALEREIGALPARQRVVFTLAAVEGFRLSRIAEMLAIDAGTARYHLSRARARLRERLRAHLVVDEVEA